MFIYREREVTLVPGNVWSSCTTTIQHDFAYDTKDPAGGFYELVGYTGANFACDFLAVCDFVGYVDEKLTRKLIDQFLYCKVLHHIGENSNCIVPESSINKENVFIRLTPTQTVSNVENWLDCDIVIEIKYWEMRATYTNVAQHISNKLIKDKFDFSSLNPISSIKPIDPTYNGTNLHLCYSASIQRAYWDYDRGDFNHSIKKHNYEILQCNVNTSRTPQMVESHSQVKQQRENKNKKKNQLAKKPAPTPDAQVNNNNKNSKKRKRGHQDGEWYGVGEVDPSLIENETTEIGFEEKVPENKNDDRYVLFGVFDCSDRKFCH